MRFCRKKTTPKLYTYWRCKWWSKYTSSYRIDPADEKWLVDNFPKEEDEYRFINLIPRSVLVNSAKLTVKEAIPIVREQIRIIEERTE